MANTTYLTSEATSSASHLLRPIALRILGTGEYLPKREVDAGSFDDRWQKSAGWAMRHVGVARRHFADSHETSSFMGARAGERALRSAGLAAGDLDCIVSACSVMEQALPCSASLLQRELGLGNSGIPAFDVNASCLSFVVALDLVATALLAGRYRRVLIVSSEVPSAGLNWQDTETAALFGDGAAAVVVESCADTDSAVLGACLRTYGDGAELCQVRAGGTRLRVCDDMEAFVGGAHFEMQGKAVYRQAARRLPEFLDALASCTGVALGSVDRIIPHQASAKALSHLQRALNLPADRITRILEQRGNQMAASIPAALHHAIHQQGLQRGQLVGLVGSGAGLSFGGLVLRY